MESIDQDDGSIDELPMNGGVFCRARKSGRREDRFFVMKMLDNIANQGVQSQWPPHLLDARTALRQGGYWRDRTARGAERQSKHGRIHRPDARQV